MLNLPNDDLVLLYPGDLLGRVPHGGVGVAGGGAGDGGVGVGDNVLLPGSGDGGSLDPVPGLASKLDHFFHENHK